MAERGTDPERRVRVVALASVVSFAAFVAVTDTTELHGWTLYLVDAIIAVVIYAVATWLLHNDRV